MQLNLNSEFKCFSIIILRLFLYRKLAIMLHLRNLMPFFLSFCPTEVFPIFLVLFCNFSFCSLIPLLFFVLMFYPCQYSVLLPSLALTLYIIKSPPFSSLNFLCSLQMCHVLLCWNNAGRTADNVLTLLPNYLCTAGRRAMMGTKFLQNFPKFFKKT